MTIRSSRWTSALTSVLAFALVLSGCTASSSPKHPPSSSRPSADTRPNIVFVLTDDLSTDLVQYMPHVLALERQGTSFSHYFVVDSLCCPSRAAIFTGRYPHDDGVYTNGGHDGGYAAFNRHHDAGKSFAVSLHVVNYRTAFMGKYLNGYQPAQAQPAGWDEWDVAGNGYPEFGYQLNENGRIRSYGHRRPDYLTDVLSTKADRFIASAARGDQPFALEVATFAPHHPWVPAPRDHDTFPSLRAPRGPAFDRPVTDAPPWLAGYPPLSRSDIEQIDRGYRLRVESVQAVDRLLGRIERTLSRSGVERNTYVVFSSDNGFHMGQHRLLPGKQTVFDTDIRVPLVVSGPGVTAGRVVPTMTSSIDLAPTFDQIGETTPTAPVDGTSLLDLWHGRPAPASGAVLIEHHGPARAATDPDRQPKRSGDPPDYEAIRTPTETYAEYADGQREYYDLVTDPTENHNTVARLSSRQRARLHGILHALEVCHSASACRAAGRLR